MAIKDFLEVLNEIDIFSGSNISKTVCIQDY